MWELLPPLAVVAALALMYRPDIPTKASIALHFLLALPFLALLSRFMVYDDSILLVVLHGGENLPLKYRIASTWAAREGPILLWVAWLSLVAWIWRKPMSEESEQTHFTRLRLVHGSSLILLLLGWMLEPFTKAKEGTFGAGLNPLLQTDLMVIHPPLIFLAYSLCIMLGAIGLSSLANQSKGIQSRALAVARPAFVISTLGIGLGGLWAYTVLDWGGYWAWDPVETGSMLPWLSLIILLHLRTRPGKVEDGWWALIAITSALMAFMATMVTRAGGVWASSIHTFVIEGDGTPPDSVWGRLMLLRSDGVAGVEIMTYLLVMMMISSAWIGWRLTGKIRLRSMIVLPIIAFFGMVIGADILDGVHGILIALIGILPLVDVAIKHRQSVHYSAILVIIGVLVSSFLHGDEFIAFISLSLAIAMLNHDSWGFPLTGVALHLSASWAAMIEIIPAAIGIVSMLIPFIIAESEDSTIDVKQKKVQQRIALWAPVVLVSCYLVMTWTILVASIDSVQFTVHELYGAPLILLVILSLLIYHLRKSVDSEKLLYLISSLLILTPILSWWLGDELPGDADDELSSLINRGNVAMLLLPALAVALIPASKEVWQRFTIWRSDFSSRTRRIPFAAHLVHLGLLLLLIGHVFSTTLVDRGSATHRVTLIEDEPVIHGDLAYTLGEVILISEDSDEFKERFDVGDGYIGVEVIINEVVDGKVGDEITRLEPGVLRFGATARSEVSIHSGLHGDLILILDTTQATSLMQNEGDVVKVRITAFDLPASHLVWIGWVLMLIGGSMTISFARRQTQ